MHAGLRDAWPFVIAGLAGLSSCQSFEGSTAPTSAAIQGGDRVRFTNSHSAGGVLPLQIALDQRLDPRVEATVRQEMEAMADRLSQQLALPSAESPVHLTLFGDEPSYRRHVATRFPNFPVRRALFAETPQGMDVIAQWGPHVAEDLRHETVHAFLHASLQNLPLWLDEGLAEYFETTPASGALQPGHVNVLATHRQIADWSPSLQRLEGLVDPAVMTEVDYAESWLWVAWLLATPNESQLLRDYLADLQKTTGETPLSRRLGPSLAAIENQMSLWIESR